jgi:hypothetical protein
MAWGEHVVCISIKIEGKIGSIALKDHKNQKIPPKKLRYVKYHPKIELLKVASSASAPWISFDLIKIKK